MAQQFLHDPDARLDYRFDWRALTNGYGTSNWLATGETIVDTTVTADAGLTVDSSSVVSDDTAVVVWLSGGAVGGRYYVTCHIVTSAGREDDRTITIYGMQR